MTTAPFPVHSASDRELVEYYELVSAISEHDRPGEPVPAYDAVIGQLKTHFTGWGPRHYWSARLNGKLVGITSVGTPDLENATLAVIDIRVHPAARRQGVGAALLRAAHGLIGELNKDVVTAVGVDADSPATVWGSNLGFKVVEHEVVQHLMVKSVDHGIWEVDVPAGFRLLQWVNTAPVEYLTSFADARNAIHDRPHGDSSFVPPRWTADRIREAEDDLRSRRVEQRVVAVLEAANNAIVGLTVLEIYPHRPSVGVQQDTAVLASHRGFGLGRVIKTAMLRWLIAEQPAVDKIVTCTAADNSHMIRVNHQIGFVTVRSMVDLEQATEALTRRLADRYSSN